MWAFRDIFVGKWGMVTAFSIEAGCFIDAGVRLQNGRETESLSPTHPLLKLLKFSHIFEVTIQRWLKEYGTCVHSSIETMQAPIRAFQLPCFCCQASRKFEERDLMDNRTKNVQADCTQRLSVVHISFFLPSGTGHI